MSEQSTTLKDATSTASAIDVILGAATALEGSWSPPRVARLRAAANLLRGRVAVDGVELAQMKGLATDLHGYLQGFRSVHGGTLSSYGRSALDQACGNALHLDKWFQGAAASPAEPHASLSDKLDKLSDKSNKPEPHAPTSEGRCTCRGDYYNPSTGRHNLHYIGCPANPKYDPHRYAPTSEKP